MALIDRIFQDDPDPDRHIANHRFSAWMLWFAKGSKTRPQVVAAFEMTTEDEVQLDELIAHFQGLNANDKREFHSLVEAAGILAENTGDITKAEYRAFLGMS